MSRLHITTAFCPPPVAFASEEIRRSAPAETDLEVIFSITSTGTPSTQAYSLHVENRRVIVSSADPAGRQSERGRKPPLPSAIRERLNLFGHIDTVTGD